MTTDRRTADRATTAAITAAAGTALPTDAHVWCSLSLGRAVIRWQSTHSAECGAPDWTDRIGAAYAEVTAAMSRLTEALAATPYRPFTCKVGPHFDSRAQHCQARGVLTLDITE